VRASCDRVVRGSMTRPACSTAFALSNRRRSDYTPATR
jgi:hypothetical protein